MEPTWAYIDEMLKQGQQPPELPIVKETQPLEKSLLKIVSEIKRIEGLTVDMATAQAKGRFTSWWVSISYLHQ